MRPFAGVVISRLVICDGQEIARAAYTQLYAVIGTTYKANPTEGFFAVPDLRGRFHWVQITWEIMHSTL